MLSLEQKKSLCKDMEEVLKSHYSKYNLGAGFCFVFEDCISSYFPDLKMTEADYMRLLLPEIYDYAPEKNECFMHWFSLRKKGLKKRLKILDKMVIRFENEIKFRDRL